MVCVPFSVGTSEVHLVERCGKFSHIARPGLNFLMPCLCDSAAGKLTLRLQELSVVCEAKTMDNVFINMAVSVQYQVVSTDESIYNAFYRLTNPRQQIESYVYDVVRSSVPRLLLDDVFTQKEEISTEIKKDLTEAMAQFGFEILATPITDIEPNAEVKAAMNQINKAKRLRVAAQDQGEAAKIKSIKEAEADASRIEIQAKAEAEAKYMAGVGISRQRKEIMSGLRESVNTFKAGVDDISSKSVIDMMVVTQYFDTMKGVGGDPKTAAIFMNGEKNVGQAAMKR